MAEIRQKIISCSQGHYYDANRYDSCPYCNSGSFSPTVDPFAPQAQGVSPTVAWRGPGLPWAKTMGGFSPTAAAPAARACFRCHGEDPVCGLFHPGGGPFPCGGMGW